MNVLSLFDGMSCGQIALNRCGIKYDNYYAAEIDKYSMQITQKNYPNTIQLGDIRNIEVSKLPKIDLLMGGSPCQSFSFSGKRNGMTTKDKIEIISLEQYLELKEQNFEFEGQSYLFWEYVKILKEIKPRYFLLENVKMSKKWENTINKALGCYPVEINSSLVSAQNRKRLYWTNISNNIKQPEDRHIYLKDILEYGLVDRDKSYCLDANYFKGGNLKQYFEKNRRQLVFNNLIQLGYFKKDMYGRRVYDINGKSSTLRSKKDNNYYKTKDCIRLLTPLECERLQTVPDNYTEDVSNTQRYRMIGNGWTVDVICHIFNYILDPYKDCFNMELL